MLVVIVTSFVKVIKAYPLAGKSSKQSVSTDCIKTSLVLAIGLAPIVITLPVKLSLVI